MGDTSAVDDLDVERVLTAVNDAACRRILSAATEPMTATEFSEVCGIPVSTVYRKLDRLTDAGLLVKRYRVRLPGRNPREYHRRFDRVDVVIGGNEGGVSIDVDRRRAADVPRPVADGGSDSQSDSMAASTATDGDDSARGRGADQR